MLLALRCFMNIPQLILKPGKEKSLERFHPWVFSGAIARIDGQPANGDLVAVLAQNRTIIGFGHYQQGSITARILCFGNEKPGPDFWAQRLQEAWALRNTLHLPNPDTNVFRLVHGEGDRLPGLIIDIYDKVAVMQCHSLGMYHARHEIAKALQAIPGLTLEAIYDKSEETLHKDSDAHNGYLFGAHEGETEVREYGHRFRVNWVTGQKTGFFIDQRENRKLLQHYAKGKKILNTFCYSGGFSIYALHEEAREVHSLDSSKKAIALTEQNVALAPHADRHRSIVADALPYLRDIGNDYDIVILDPPAFAKHLSAKHNAIQGYRRLNEEALRQIKPGGLLFTFSCSQAIDQNTFTGTVLSAAINARRNVRILHRLHQPADHPVSLYHPEGEYLKGLVVYVD